MEDDEDHPMQQQQQQQQVAPTTRKPPSARRSTISNSSSNSTNTTTPVTGRIITVRSSSPTVPTAPVAPRSLSSPNVAGSVDAYGDDDNLDDLLPPPLPPSSVPTPPPPTFTTTTQAATTTSSSSRPVSKSTSGSAIHRGGTPPPLRASTNTIGISGGGITKKPASPGVNRWKRTSDSMEQPAAAAMGFHPTPKSPSPPAQQQQKTTTPPRSPQQHQNNFLGNGENKENHFFNSGSSMDLTKSLEGMQLAPAPAPAAPGPVVPVNALFQFMAAAFHQQQQQQQQQGFSPMASMFEDRAEATLRPWGLITYQFHHSATGVVPAPDTQMRWLNTRNEIFGLNECRQLLERNIGMPYRFPEVFRPETRRPSHFMYLYGPSGSGLRLLVTNYCREQRINFVSIRDTRGYEDTLYRALMSYVAQRTPVVVLIDRIDYQWTPNNFGNTGNELLSQWRGFQHQFHLQQLEQQRVREDGSIEEPAFPRVWFVITSSMDYHALHPYIRDFIGTSNNAAAEALTEKDYTAVMRSAAQRCLQEIGFPNDIPDPTLIQTDRTLFHERLRHSRLYHVMGMYHALFTLCIQRWMHLHQQHGDPGTMPTLAPRQAAMFIENAFKRAFLRCLSAADHQQQQRLCDPLQQLPLFYDFVQVADTSLVPYRITLHQYEAEIAPTLPSAQNLLALQQQQQQREQQQQQQQDQEHHEHASDPE